MRKIPLRNNSNQGSHYKQTIALHNGDNQQGLRTNLLCKVKQSLYNLIVGISKQFNVNLSMQQVGQFILTNIAEKKQQPPLLNHTKLHITKFQTKPKPVINSNRQLQDNNELLSQIEEEKFYFGDSNQDINESLLNFQIRQQNSGKMGKFKKKNAFSLKPLKQQRSSPQLIIPPEVFQTTAHQRRIYKEYSYNPQILYSNKSFHHFAYKKSVDIESRKKNLKFFKQDRYGKDQGRDFELNEENRCRQQRKVQRDDGQYAFEQEELLSDGDDDGSNGDIYDDQQQYNEFEQKTMRDNFTTLFHNQLRLLTVQQVHNFYSIFQPKNTSHFIRHIKSESFAQHRAYELSLDTLSTTNKIDKSFDFTPNQQRITNLYLTRIVAANYTNRLFRSASMQKQFNIKIDARNFTTLRKHVFKTLVRMIEQTVLANKSELRNGGIKNNREMLLIFKSMSGNIQSKFTYDVLMIIQLILNQIFECGISQRHWQLQQQQKQLTRLDIQRDIIKVYNALMDKLQQQIKRRQQTRLSSRFKSKQKNIYVNNVQLNVYYKPYFRQQERGNNQIEFTLMDGREFRFIEHPFEVFNSLELNCIEVKTLALITRFPMWTEMFQVQAIKLVLLFKSHNLKQLFIPTLVKTYTGYPHILEHFEQKQCWYQFRRMLVRSIEFMQFQFRTYIKLFNIKTLRFYQIKFLTITDQQMKWLAHIFAGMSLKLLHFTYYVHNCLSFKQKLNKQEWGHAADYMNYTIKETVKFLYKRKLLSKKWGDQDYASERAKYRVEMVENQMWLRQNQKCLRNFFYEKRNLYTRTSERIEAELTMIAQNAVVYKKQTPFEYTEVQYQSMYGEFNRNLQKYFIPLQQQSQQMDVDMEKKYQMLRQQMIKQRDSKLYIQGLGVGKGDVHRYGGRIDSKGRCMI